MDIWMYIQTEGIDIPNLYFAHQREVVKREGMWMATFPQIIEPLPGETAETRLVRFRTIGDISCTGAVESAAANLQEVIQEVAAARVTERGGRADDKRYEAAMEDRKKQGYF
jgi:sulfate adenylyltransferase subunit 2